MEQSYFAGSLWWSVPVAAALMVVVIGSWIWFLHATDPVRGTIDEPDATAHTRGKCGDAMKISLMFSAGRVKDAKYWTDGCRMSASCGAAAARIALGKTPEELADVDHLAIEREVGVLPDEDRHCATLAAGTLQEALRIYLTRDPEPAREKTASSGAVNGPSGRPVMGS